MLTPAIIKNMYTFTFIVMSYEAYFKQYDIFFFFRLNESSKINISSIETLCFVLVCDVVNLSTYIII